MQCSGVSTPHWRNQNYEQRDFYVETITFLRLSSSPLRHLANLKVPVHYQPDFKRKIFCLFLVKKIHCFVTHPATGKGKGEVIFPTTTNGFVKYYILYDRYYNECYFIILYLEKENIGAKVICSVISFVNLIIESLG